MDYLNDKKIEPRVKALKKKYGLTNYQALCLLQKAFLFSKLSNEIASIAAVLESRGWDE